MDPGQDFAMAGTKPRRSDRFLSSVNGKKTAIVTHDNPDPDAIASGWALVALLKSAGNHSVRLIGRGAIVRAENVHMLRLLNPPLELVDELPEDMEAVVLVDCEPTAGNHPLQGTTLHATAVLDHHEPNGTSFRVKHRDIRPRAAATAGIAASYLREQRIEPCVALATALLYAIRTEIAGPESRLSRSDRGIIAWLSGYADHAKLAEIQAAPLSRAYFRDLLAALENAFLYDYAAVCFLPHASGTEIVGEVADLLIRCEGVNKVLCAASIENNLILSARTTPEDGDVIPLLRATMSGFGNCGGHRHRAGGKIPCISADGRCGGLMLDTIRNCWLAACEVVREPCERLIPKQSNLVEPAGRVEEH